MKCPNCCEELETIAVCEAEHLNTALIVTCLGKCLICGTHYEWDEYYTFANAANLRALKPQKRN